MYFHPLNTNISVPSTKNQNMLEEKRYLSIFVDICRFFLKYFDFWLIGPKYSCSADENTSENCLFIKNFFFFGIEFSSIFSKVCICLSKFFEVRMYRVTHFNRRTRISRDLSQVEKNGPDKSYRGQRGPHNLELDL